MDNSRPTVICHMMTSIDGKITYGKVNGTDPDFSVFGDYMDLYNETHAQLGTTWMCGRVTLAEFSEPSDTSLDAFSDVKINDQDFVNTNELKNYAIGVDAKGSLRWKENHLYIGKEKVDKNKYYLIMIVTQQTSKEYLAYLRDKNISYIIAGGTEVNFAEAMEKLKQLFGIDTILLEGGGSINGSMLDEDLVDEISLLMIPKVINNVDAPALFYKKLEQARLHEFKLQDVQKLDKDVMWMRWSKLN